MISEERKKETHIMSSYLYEQLTKKNVEKGLKLVKDLDGEVIHTGNLQTNECMNGINPVPTPAFKSK